MLITRQYTVPREISDSANKTYFQQPFSRLAAACVGAGRDSGVIIGLSQSIEIFYIPIPRRPTASEPSDPQSGAFSDEIDRFNPWAMALAQ